MGSFTCVVSTVNVHLCSSLFFAVFCYQCNFPLLYRILEFRGEWD